MILYQLITILPDHNLDPDWTTSKHKSDSDLGHPSQFDHLNLGKCFQRDSYIHGHPAPPPPPSSICKILRPFMGSNVSGMVTLGSDCFKAHVQNSKRQHRWKYKLHMAPYSSIIYTLYISDIISHIL